jgi:hypothetical protein
MLRFRILGSGFRVYDRRLKVKGLRVKKVWGSEIKDSDLGSRGFELQGSRSGIVGSECRV